MEFLNGKGVVYTPLKDVDLGPYSTEFYLQANVKGSPCNVFSFFLILFFPPSWYLDFLFFWYGFPSETS